MGIRVRAVDSRADRRAFVDLPYRIYRDDPAWVPPLRMEEKAALDERRNPFFEHGEAQYFLAERDGRVVGRISAHVNHLHNRRYEDRVGFFGWFECEEDEEAAHALLSAVEDWLRTRGMDTARGPMSFSTNDLLGTLVSGFEHSPMLLMSHGRPYYDRLIASAGYEKAKDLLAWEYEVGEVNDFCRTVADQVAAHPGLVVRPADKKNLGRDIRILMDVYNEAWSDNWGFVPLTPRELDKLVKEVKLIIEPELALVAEVDGEPAAVAITLPNLNEAIQGLDGRLLPFGWAKLLWRLKVRRPRSARMALLGIRRKYRGSALGGLSILLYVRTHEAGVRLGVERGELGWTLEDNERINQGIELMGGRRYKTYRVYDKPL